MASRLQVGAYRLRADVVNPHPQPRVKRDWTKHAVWKAGQRFFVELVNQGEREVCIRRVGFGEGYALHEAGSVYGAPNEALQFRALAAQLESVPEDLETRFARLGLGAYDLEAFLRFLVEQKTVSMARLEASFLVWRQSHEE